MKSFDRSTLLYLAVLAILIGISSFSFFRIDLTTEKRYTVAKRTKELMASTKYPVEVIVYLDGNLNAGFQNLKRSTVELLEELSVYSSKDISIRFVNPSVAETPAEREKKYSDLAQAGFTPTIIYERDKEGKSIQKIIFPWIELRSNGRSVPVGLLKNIKSLRAEDNLNISIENLEFEITDGLRRLFNTQLKKIAFLEGHGELNEAETYSISKSLSRYFQIDRGVIGTDASILQPYEAIIIARPTKPFSETEKFIIDQYIMYGGKVLWLIDAVRVDKQSLSTSGLSPALEYELNLHDQFFKYGVRINPVLIQDVQCVQVPVNIAPLGEKPQFEPSPWYFAPLLLTSPAHPISRNVAEVRGEFTSTIQLVGDNKQVKYQFLLASSDNTHLFGTPSTIDVGVLLNPSDKSYFNTGYVPVAVVLEGNFESNFTNRMLPRGLSNSNQLREKSIYTRQIFVADADIIRNETNGIASDSTTVELGYDRYMNQQFGNKDFIQNAVLYLTDKAGWMELRNRTLKLRLLNKRMSSSERISWQLINTLTPLMLLALFGIGYQVVRRRKYTIQ